MTFKKFTEKFVDHLLLNIKLAKKKQRRSVIMFSDGKYIV